MRGRAIALVFVWLLIAHPVAVEASTYSTVQHQLYWSPNGAVFSSLCTQSGVVTTVSNYGYTLVVWAGPAPNNDPPNNLCTNPHSNLDPNNMRVKVKGYRSGTFCGASNWYSNNVRTYGWQLWIQLCSDPSGTQAFDTLAYSAGKKAGENLTWFYGGGVDSPTLFH